MPLTPGSNLLRRASRLIKLQPLTYYPFNARTQNAAFQWVPSFGSAIPFKGSVQAVDRKSYKDMGLQFQSFYVQLWMQYDIVDIDRDTSGDRFIYNGDLYALKDGVDWFSQDGWSSCIGVRIKRGAAGPN